VALCTLGPNIGFDLPVLHYRARVHAIPAAGLAARPYFKRYSDYAIDLCHVLSSFIAGKTEWHQRSGCRAIPPRRVDSRHSRVREAVWLRYELFRRGLSHEAFRASKDNLVQFINMRENSRGKRERVLLVKDTKKKN